jgi:hypothetical protein
MRPSTTAWFIMLAVSSGKRGEDINAALDDLE